MKQTKACPYCGESIKAAAIKCRYCGSMLTETPTSGWQDFDTMIRNALASKYEIVNEVGKGGMAIVYKAIQKNLNREVALKVIHPNLVHDIEFLSRFHQEAKLAAALNHPNIVKIYDEGESKGIHFMAMEFLDGEDLQAIIRKRGKLSIDDSLSTIKTIAKALNYIHSKGQIHRDIKSSNIFVTSDGRPVLTDFGIAHAVDSPKMTQLGAVFGTPEYMSPEQAQGKELDHRSDLFSLSIVLYECLTGHVPYKGETSLTTINLILSGTCPPLREARPDVPFWLDQLMKNLLNKNPDHRPASSGNELVRLLDGQNPDNKPIKAAPKIVKSGVGPARKIRSRKRETPPYQLIRGKRPFKILIGTLIFIACSIITLIIILSIQLNSPSVTVKPTYDSAERQEYTPSYVHETSIVASPIVVDTVNQHDTIEPSYRGGNAAIQQFLESHITYPVEAKNAGIKGIVIIGFMVNTDGSISSISVLRGTSSPECDEEVLNAVYQLPGNWIPGRINNEPANLYSIIYYTFK